MTEPPTAVRRGIPRPRVALAAGGLAASAAVVAAMLQAPWPVLTLIGITAIAVAVLATLVAVRRDSRVVAPLAVALVALVNPVVLTAVSDHVVARVGVVSFTLDRGFVLWGVYPGIAGWDPPADPPLVDIGGIARTSQDAVRDVVDATSSAFGWAWRVGDQPSGARAIVNGWGGVSAFWRIDSPTWISDDAGDLGRRAVLTDAVAGAAERLDLPFEADVDGDVDTGDGVRAWSDDLGGTLFLQIAGARATVWYTGGPFLATTVEDFEERLEPFEGLLPPATIEEPDLP
ncbi:hypothetical protein [Microbacterium awajiense]|uniref:hypothetical protein n=1 Tax=Microbacterium awajiense TaxID=415214 RepID=UPI0031D74F47